METEIVIGTTQLSTSISTFSPQQIPACWRAIEFLSSNLSSFPVEVADQTNGKQDHSLDRLLSRKANPTATSKTTLKTWFYHGETYGNGYLYIQRDNRFNPVGLWTLLPEDVTPFRFIPEGGSLFDSEIWYHHGPSQKPFPAADILHYRPQVSHDGLTGYSPAFMFAPTFARAQMLEVYQTKFLRRGSLIRGSIEFPTGTTKEQAAAIMAQIREFRAATQDKDIIGLFGGAKLNNTTITPVDAQLIEQDNAIIKKIAQIYGVSQQFLFDVTDTKYNGATVEAYGQDVVRFTFRPRLELVEPELTTKLLSEAEQDAGLSIRFDTTALIRGDTAVETATAAQGVAGGLITRNEARQDIGLAPVADAGADKLLIPSAVATESTTQAESETHSQDAPPDQYAALRPLLDDAANRVERKTAKALETANKKPEPERIAYSNVLADQQAKYAIEAIQPVAEAITKLTGDTIDVEQIGQHYAAEIRRRASGQEPKTLQQIMGEHGRTQGTI